jgi:hypothetical protein
MTRIRNLLFAAGVLAAMGFGATTARAEPNPRDERVICPFVRSAEECTDCCADGGFNGDFVGGRCTCY